jgi:serine protease
VRRRQASPLPWRAFPLPLGAALLAAAACGAGASEAAAAEATRPNDPLFKYQWHLRQIGIPQAWAASRGRGAVVALIDTGVAYEDRGKYRRAPDLAGTRFTSGWDFVDDDAHPNDVPPRRRRSHGTHLAGIIAQTTGNRVGGAGVAPEATIMPIRVLRPDVIGTATTIARGLRFAADHGADVANLSLAGTSDKRVVRDAVRYAVSKGVTVVAAAGNAGTAPVSFPAAYPGVIAVGALTRSRSRAYYSNFGRALDLVAPAGDRQIVEEGFERGDGVLQQTLNGDGPATFCFCFMASTSAAAAQVSGVAALLVASGRATRPAAVRAALTESARDLGPPGRDNMYGAGLVQASAALQDPGGDGPGGKEDDASGGVRTDGWKAFALLLAAMLVAAAALFVIRRRRRPES